MDILGPVNGSSKSFDGRRVGNLTCRENILQIELTNILQIELANILQIELANFLQGELANILQGNFQRVGIEQLYAFMFCCYCEGGCSVQPNKYKTGLKTELFVTKRYGHFD